MKYTVSVLLLLSIVSVAKVFGTSDPGCPRFCTLQYEPVCGSDGNTYGSPCALRAHNCRGGTHVAMVHPGECVRDCPMICPRLLAPVCGSDGDTYNNRCELRSYNCRTGSHVTVVHPGYCSSSSEADSAEAE